MQRCGFDPPLRRIFPVEGIFPLESTWFLTLFPQNSSGWEYKPRSSLCTHALHDKDSKKLSIHECRQQKQTQHAPSTKTECDYANGCIRKKGHIHKNLTQNGEPQRYSWGTQKKKKKKKRDTIFNYISAAALADFHSSPAFSSLPSKSPHTSVHCFPPLHWIGWTWRCLDPSSELIGSALILKTSRR